MRYLLFGFTLASLALTSNAQQPSSDADIPLNLRVMVRYSHEKDDPVRAAYLYRKLREVPNVTLVREDAGFFLDVNTITAKNGISIMQFVVLQPAGPVFRDVVADRVEAKLQMQNVAAWQTVGSLIRAETVKIPGAFFYKGMVGYSATDANTLVDGVVKSFEVTYVEPARLADRETKDHMHALEERAANAKTPEEKRDALAAMAEFIGLPTPPPTKKP